MKLKEKSADLFFEAVEVSTKLPANLDEQPFIQEKLARAKQMLAAAPVPVYLLPPPKPASNAPDC